jgi:hypothetical protein
MTGEYEIDGTGPAGERFSVKVKIVCVGNKAISEITPSRPLTPGEAEALECAIEELVHRETGRAVQRDGSERCKDDASAAVRARRYLGGGLG